MTNTVTSGSTASRANLAAALGGVALILLIVAMFVAGDDDSANGWMWPVAGVLGLAGAIIGWMAGKPKPQGRALLGVVTGGLTAAVIIGWLIWAAATGNF